MNDADKYIWLLANMGLVDAKIKEWNPGVDMPLLRYLDKWITKMAHREGSVWLNQQRSKLNGDL